MGKDPDGKRRNDCHYTKKVNQAAQAAGNDKP